MAPRRRGRGTTKAALVKTESQQDMDIYNSLLAEARADDAGSERPQKRRKTASRNLTAVPPPDATPASSPARPSLDDPLIENGTAQPARQSDREGLTSMASSRDSDAPDVKQTAYTDAESDSEASDMDLAAYLGDESATDDAAARETSGDLSVELRADTRSTPRQQKTASRGITAREKQVLTDVHKLHVLCLLAHNHQRNVWCNDEVVQQALLSLVTVRMRKFLFSSTDETQYTRSRNFQDGLKQASELWHKAFKKTAPGIRRSAAIASEAAIMELHDDFPTDLTEFREAARQRKGDRDLGAQLFCAMLRGIGVDTRLVCSLQTSSFTGRTTVSQEPETLTKAADYFDEYGRFISGTASETGSDRGDFAHSRSASPDCGTPSSIKRLGNRTFSKTVMGKMPHAPSPPPPKRSKPIVDSTCPTYWVECFDEAVQKWIPVDSMATRTVNRASRLEPAMRDPLNSMSYVIAFESDYAAKDVTRRYAKAYNAKTRLSRIEMATKGNTWWKCAMKVFRGGFHADRDEIEEAELTRREASEPIPSNIQDFKTHPHYALERHLKRNEIIYPRREVGKLASSKADGGSEPIYRRQDVQIVRSSDKWFRCGREVRLGEQPLKFSKPRKQGRLGSEPLEGEEAESDIGLYSESQTDVYRPPAVVDGQIPRNGFGNLDVYADSMIPAGGAHVRSSDAKEAARLLGVDFAEAVTGFTFKARKGTAVIRGIVIAIEFVEAIEAVIADIRTVRSERAALRRQEEALDGWRRLFKVLKIRERVLRGMGSDVADAEVGEQVAKAQDDEAEIEQEGGFFADADVPLPQPTTGEVAAPQQTAFDDVADINDLDAHEQGGKRHFWQSTVLSPWPPPLDQVVISGEPTAAQVEAGGFMKTADEPTEAEEAFVEQQGGEDSADDALSEGGFLRDGRSDLPKKDPQGLLVAEEQRGESTAQHHLDATRDAGDNPLQHTSPPSERAVTTMNDSVGGEAEHGEAIEQSDVATPTSLISHDPDDDEAEPDWLDGEATL